jgi:DNA-binding NtrC family response regulator
LSSNETTVEEDSEGDGKDEGQDGRTKEGARGGNGPDDVTLNGFTNELHLLIMSPVSFGSFPLPSQGDLVVGRSANCPIRIEDPLASREHARLHVNPDQEGSGFRFHIEDLNSANGTRVRDKRIPPGKAVPLFVGEAIKVGSTVLMLQQSRPTLGAGRLWSRAYFEGLLESECGRASEDTAFAVARIHMGAQTSWSRIVPILVREVPFPHVFAAYGPRDYEILFRERSPNEVVRRLNRLIGEFQKCAIVANQAVAWYPRDGVTARTLFDRMDALLRVRTGEAAVAWPADEPQPRVAPPTVIEGAAASAPEVAEVGVPGAAGVAAAAQGEPVSAAGMTRLLEMARRAAARKINVLILGETGAGKEVLARTIHDLSGRRGKFVALNCASLPETLVESELFGYEKGAFSGASSAKLGLMEAGNGGTVFLDEIGEMPERIQARLLRALETREILPVGAVKPRPIDVRFLAATNRDLELEVRNGRFRRDLFFRLNGISLTIPPLRDRASEIPDLVRIFLMEASREAGDEEPPRVAPESMRLLLDHAWPGNIRELKNSIERALVLCDGPEILPEHLLPLGQIPDDASTRAPAATPPEPGRAADRYASEIGAAVSADGQEPAWLADPMKAAERTAILAALDANAWSQTRAAKALGIPRRTFVSKLAYYGIPRPQRQRQRVDEPTNG